MTIIELTGDNAFDFQEYMGEDMAENLEREFYRGYVVMSDSEEFLAGLVWEYNNLDDEADTESVIKWLRIEDQEALELLFSAYSEEIAKEDAVCSYFVIPVKNNKNEKEALKKAGFSVKLTEGDHIIVSLHELSELPIMANRKVPDNVGILSQLPLRQFRKGVAKCDKLGHKGLCRDLTYLPMRWFEQDVSTFAKNEDNITGLFLFHRLPSGMLTVQLMVAMEKNPQQTLLGLMRQFVISMEEKYTPETKILLDRHNQASLLLTEKLLPRGFGIPVYTGSRVEKG